VANRFFQARTYISYWLDAVDEHSLHSPFFFDFYTRVVKNKTGEEGIASIEQLRNKLLADHRPLKTRDPGSRQSNKPRTVSSITQTSVSPLRFSGIYSRMIQHFKAHTILELGTSVGINTLYLAQQRDSSITTFEGSPELADMARLTFDFAEARNIRLIEGNLDRTLSEFLQTIRKIDFILMDANHRYQPTVSYFESLLTRISESSIVVLDDIHYSAEMEKAWNELKTHKLVYGSADLYRCGILFFDPSLNKQHVILQL
jgi:predicted O-methyltransferase YrrM